MSKYIFTGQSSGRVGSHTVAEQFPMFGEGRPVHFWAEHGLVRFEDSRDDVPIDKKTGAMSWRDAAERVLALSEMIIHSSEDPRWGAERQRMQKFISEMEEVIREAKSQGSPFDEGALAEMRRRRPKSVVVPTTIENFTG